MPLDFQQTGMVLNSNVTWGPQWTTTRMECIGRFTPRPRNYCVDGGVLLDIDKGLCYSLNLVGAKIWLAIESGHGQTTFEHIVKP